MYAQKPIPLPFGGQERPAPRTAPSPIHPIRNTSGCHPLAAWLLWELLRG